jgi:peptidoglycan hydrolase CwlO-like protein
MEKLIFLFIAVVFLGVELFLVYRRPKIILGTLFVVSFLGFLAFYLFQFGPLQSFTVEGFAAKANFVKQKMEEVKQDSKAIKELKNNIEVILNELEETQREINRYKDKLITVQGELVDLERGIVEITYLQYAGRNRFPNPYHERILEKLNELLRIGVPDPNQRASFVQELKEYTQEENKK